MEKNIRRKKIKTGMLHHKISKQGRLCPDLGQKCPFLLRPTGGEGGSANETRVEYTPLEDALFLSHMGSLFAAGGLHSCV